MDETEPEERPPIEPMAERFLDDLAGEDASSLEETDFRLTVAVDVHREKALILRVLLIIEVCIGLVILREVVLLFLLDS